MNLASFPSSTRPQVSLPSLSILGQPPATQAQQAPADQQAVTYSGEAKSNPAFIMVGLDDKAKPHASWFAADQAEAAAHAADLMDMALIEVSDEQLAAIAAALPPGRLFDSGKAFVPFVKRATYDQLAVYLSEEYLATATERVESASVATNSDYAAASQGEVAPPHYPEHWSKIAANDIVLASEGHDDGWWQATVVADQGNGNFLLRWTDWPELDQVVRHVTQLALLHPQFKLEAAQ